MIGFVAPGFGMKRPVRLTLSLSPKRVHGIRRILALNDLATLRRGTWNTRGTFRSRRSIKNKRSLRLILITASVESLHAERSSLCPLCLCGNSSCGLVVVAFRRGIRLIRLIREDPFELSS
jgi:hypothetical protein